MKLRAGWIVACLVGLLAIAGADASSAAAESLCTDTWTGPAEGAWETASDWSLGRAPSSLDVACIGAGTTVRVSSGSQAAAVVQGEGTLAMSAGTLELASAFEVSRVSAFKMNGGTLTGAGTLEASGSFVWENEGTLAGSGSLVVAKGAAGTVQKSTGAFSEHVIKRPVVNEGTLTENAEAGMEASEGVTITNKGTFVADGYGIKLGSGATPTFVNESTFEEAGPSSSTFKMAINFNDEGPVAVKSGYLNIEDHGSSGAKASWSATAGTYVDFLNGEYSFTGGTWSGEIALNEPVNINGVDAHTATVVSNSHTTLASGSTLTVPSYTMGNGELSGAGSLKVTGTCKWTGESKITGSGTTTLLAGANGEIRNEAAANYSMTVENHTFVNEGTMTLTGEAAHLAEKGSAVFKNLGTFIANKNVTESPYEGKAKFVNRGAFRKTNDPWGTGETVVSVPFENYGRVEPLAGKIKIEHPIEVDRKTKRGGRNRSALSSLNCKLGDPVSCETGSFYESQTDIAIGGRGVGLDLTRTYNAQAAAAGEGGVFGYGWTSSFSAHLTFNGEAHTVTVVQDEGATVTFVEEGGKLVAPAWTQDTLTGNSSEGYTLTMSDQTVYRFSGAGRLENITDPNGNATTLGYNEKGQLATITDPSGRKLTLAYNAEGLVESVTDPMSHVVKYAYEAGQLTSVTLPNQANPRWRFKYDTSHRITGVVDGRGNETTNTYNSANQVIAQKDFAGHLMKWEYEPFITKVTNESTGSVTLDEYTSEDEISAVTRGYGTTKATTETFTYNERGEPLTKTDGNGHTTVYEYDGEGNRIKQVDPEGHETTWTYNARHEPTSETLPSGEKTTIEYDERGNPTRVSRPAPEEKTQVTRYEYNSHGSMTAMIDPLERKWTYGYNEAGDRTSETDPEGDKTTWGYNKDSQQTSEVSPRGNVTGGKPSEYTTTFTRDALGRVTKITQPEAQETKYVYNADSNPTEVTDPNGHKTTTNYTPDGLPSKVTQSNGSFIETTYNGATS